MKLNKRQKEHLLKGVAEGLETDELNKLAKKFKPPYTVLRSQVDYYRKSRSVKLKKLKEEGETDALMTGLALKDKRVEVLQKLADKMIADLMPEDDTTNKRWLLQVKGIGGMMNFERVEYYEFNKGEFDTLRGVMDDIARELGQRAPGVQVNNTYNFDMDKWKQDRSKRLKDIEALEA
jgi:hypothetical protein